MNLPDKRTLNIMAAWMLALGGISLHLGSNIAASMFGGLAILYASLSMVAKRGR